MPCTPTLKRSPALPLLYLTNIRRFLNSCSCYWTMVSLLNYTKRKTELLRQPSVGDNYVSDLSVTHQSSNKPLSTDQLPDFWPIDYSGCLPILENNSTYISTDMLNDSQLRSSLIHQSTPPISHMIPVDGILKCSAKATNTTVIYG